MSESPFSESLREISAERARWDALGKLPVLSWEAHGRMGATLTDVVDFAPSVIEAHEVASTAMRQNEIAASSASQSLALIAIAGHGNHADRQPIARLGLAYKAFFFFVRSQQDALYAILLVLLGNSAGPGARMSSALGERNPVGQLLKEQEPRYLPWFDHWRDLRNRVKFGVSLASLGPSANPGVSFTYQDSEGGLVIDFAPENAVRLSDATEALRMSAAGLRVAVGLVDASGDDFPD